jgi:hypothetical protein
VAKEEESFLESLFKSGQLRKPEEISDDERGQNRALILGIVSRNVKQRSWVVGLCIVLTFCSFILIGLIVYAQANIRVVLGVGFSIFDGKEFEILCVSVFGQSILLVRWIAKFLWDDMKYLAILLK